jgi:hypothetical protein
MKKTIIDHILCSFYIIIHNFTNEHRFFVQVHVLILILIFTYLSTTYENVKKMEIGKSAENGKSTLLQNVENCVREIGRNVENFRLGQVKAYFENFLIIFKLTVII